MSHMIRRVTRNYIRRHAGETPEIPPIGRLVDIVMLTVAVDTYRAYLEGQGKDGSPLLTKGLGILRRYTADMEATLQAYVVPIGDKSGAAAMKPLIRLAQRTGTLVDVTRYRADLFRRLMPWLKTKPAIFNEMFTGRVAKAAREIAMAVEEESPTGLLNKSAGIAPVSGISVTRKWVELAAEDVGAGLSVTESVMADAATAQNLGDDLQAIDTRISSTPPNTPEAADLQAKKTSIVQKIDRVSKNSKAPEAILSAASTASKTQKKTGVAERFGLTDEQREVMNATGKLVVAAGAGSGKTATVVATIAHLVDEKGYLPSQIMACSFTRAASAELEERIESQAKVSGVVVGTTHRMARDIIQRNRHDLVTAMRNTKGADRCFKIAMKQISMDVEGFQAQLETNKAILQRIEAIQGWRGIDILRSFHEQISKGRNLSDKQLAVLPKFENRGGYGGGGGYGYRRRYASTPLDFLWAKMADEDDDAPEPPSKGKFSKYDTAPVGEWFNIGKPLLNEKGERLGLKRAQLAVENFKNSGVSVAQARQEQGDVPLVALYGAYEWLKRNDPVFGPGMDFTDQLQVALQILEDDPKALAAEQSRYKVLIVDEAQDLNEIQFRMFQLAGAKADVMMYCGDDKQSIYGFRGAKPDNYVNLTKTPGFQTLLMTTNFRSGKEIVDAANRLIAHNEDRQIPMVCRSYDPRGQGAIVTKDVANHEDGAKMVAQEIKDAVDSGESPADFGILVRNNAESDAFTLSLIVRGIPYRMLKKDNGGYFGKPVVRALVSWIRIIIGGTTAEMNDAIVEAHRTPGFGLDEMFAVNLGKMARGQNFYDYIASGGQVYTDRAAWMNQKYVTPYVEAIRQVRALGSGDSSSLIRAILDLKGPKGTFVESLMKMVDEDDIIEDEGGEAGDDAIRNAALAPVRPLMLMADHNADPAQMLNFIAKMKAANEKTQKNAPETKDDWKEPAVLVGTVHGWKGLQAKHVYCCMAGGVFPNFRSDETAAQQEASGGPVTAYDEERRLAYVAITRGQDTTTVIAPHANYLGKPAGNSRFISEACIPIQGESGTSNNDESKMASTKMADHFGADLMGVMYADSDDLGQGDP